MPSAPLMVWVCNFCVRPNGHTAPLLQGVCSTPPEAWCEATFSASCRSPSCVDPCMRFGAFSRKIPPNVPRLRHGRSCWYGGPCYRPSRPRCRYDLSWQDACFPVSTPARIFGGEPRFYFRLHSPFRVGIKIAGHVPANTAERVRPSEYSIVTRANGTGRNDEAGNLSSAYAPTVCPLGFL